MSRDQRLQAVESAVVDSSRSTHGTDRPFEFRGPWFRTDEAAAYLQYRGKHALRSLYRFLKAKGIPVSHRSRRCVLIAKADLDAALKPRKPMLLRRVASR